MVRIGMLACALGFVAGGALAQPAGSSGESADAYFLAKLTGGSTLGRFVEVLQQEFRQLDANLDGELTAADADLHESIARAQMRAMSALPVLRADLDGDGMVTANELRRTLRYERRANSGQTMPAAMEAIETEIRRLMAADTDHDGRISLAEAIAIAGSRSTPQVPTNQQAVQVRQMLARFSQGGARLLPADFEAAGAALFHKVDADNNGTVSLDELTEFRRRQTEAAAHAECGMPKASEAARLVVLSAFRSEAISTVGLGSQDNKTGTGEIKIEPGSEPLYVVVISQEPTIWRVTGAAERVERVVMSGVGGNVSVTTIQGRMQAVIEPGALSVQPQRPEPATQKPLAGVTGVAADRVSFLGRSNCLHAFTEAQSTDAAMTLAAIRRDSGKEPAVVATRQNVGAFVVPSGQIRSAYEDKKQPRLVINKDSGSLNLRGDVSGVVIRTGPTELEADLEELSPGGVIDIDPAAVVADVPVVRYEVLPGAAGLLQLENAGAVTRNHRGEFLIHEKIRFPAGLSSLSAKFLLLRGVPVPDGRPDGATVISEETGRPVKFDGR